MYGNNYVNNPESTRLFPYILSKLDPHFSFKKCTFSMSKQKESTARISMWKELKIPAVYTMEASFCGPERTAEGGYHFTAEHLMEAGR